MAKNTAVELKGSMFTFLSLQLHTADPTVIGNGLADKVMQAPGFFSNTPVVVDMTRIENESSLDTAQILSTIRDKKMVPVVVGLTDRNLPAAEGIDLPVIEIGLRSQGDDEAAADQDDTLDESINDESINDESIDDESFDPDETGESSANTSDEEHVDLYDDDELDNTGDVALAEARSATRQAAQRKARKRSKRPARSTDPALDLAMDLAMSGASATARAGAGKGSAEVEVLIKPPKLVTRPVRSGQQVYAKDTDLVVLGQIGPGAEIIADNNIHVYGPLRGRALCGVGGNENARIFCQSLEAELVSVAGNYKLLEEIPEDVRGKPAQIWYANDKLIIEAL